jgi:hypothetical protein
MRRQLDVMRELSVILGSVSPVSKLVVGEV